MLCFLLILMAGSVEKDLKDWFKGKKRVVVVGVGNPIRQDDNVGLKILEGLQGKTANDLSFGVRDGSGRLPLRY
jgi:hypothetical protein